MTPQPEDPGPGDAGDRVVPADDHVHSEFSWDTGPRASMVRACARAVERGLPSIAFTEHLDFTVWGDGDRATLLGLRGREPGARQAPIDGQAYAASIAECRERFPGLRVLAGVEAGEPHLFAGSVGTYLRDNPVDRVLGSLHSLEDDGRLVGVTRVLWSDPDATMRRYLAEVVEMVERSDVFQVLAHVDFPRRYWPGGTHRFVEKDYEEEYRAVFRALAGSGRALEVNTSSPLASVDQVRWFREEGGRAVSFGSDAHQPDAVGQRFDLAVDVVEAAGFRPGRHAHDLWHR